MYLNKAFIIGNLTRDPEVRMTPGGVPVASFGVATNRVWKDQQGQKREDAQFHNIVVFGRQADVAKQYLAKGSTVYIEGRIQTTSWDAQDGTKKYRTEIVTERLQLGGRRGDAAGQQQQSGEQQKEKNAEDTKKNDEMPVIDIEGDINPDDIPF